MDRPICKITTKDNTKDTFINKVCQVLINNDLKSEAIEFRYKVTGKSIITTIALSVNYVRLENIKH